MVDAPTGRCLYERRLSESLSHGKVAAARGLGCLQACEERFELGAVREGPRRDVRHGRESWGRAARVGGAAEGARRAAGCGVGGGAGCSRGAPSRFRREQSAAMSFRCTPGMAATNTRVPPGRILLAALSAPAAQAQRAGATGRAGQLRARGSAARAYVLWSAILVEVCVVVSIEKPSSKSR